MKVVIINGSAGVGKDTFVRLCQEYDETMDRMTPINISTIDPIKEAFELLGWDGEKTEDVRKFLSDVKMEAERLFGTSEKYVTDWYYDISSDVGNTDVMFVHCREPEQIAKFVDIFKEEDLDADCHTLLITNKNVEQIISNEADANVYDYKYDYIIDNSEDLNSLNFKARMFMDLLRTENLDKLSKSSYN